MSVATDIIAALQALQAQILVANGYRTDAGLNTHLNLEYETEPPNKPCTILFPGDITDTVDDECCLGEESHYRPVKIQGCLLDDAAGTNGEDLRLDLLQAINQDRTLGGLIEDIDGDIKTKAEVKAAGDQGYISFVDLKCTLWWVTEFGGA